MKWYDEWRDALLTPGAEAPTGLSTWNGSDPAQRFGIYRNNVLVSLRDALADTFPALRDHLGHATFDQIALEYLCQNPPVSVILAQYGETFPDWMQQQMQQQPVRWQLPPWAVELARLERAYVNSFHAADAAMPTIEDWQRLLADEQKLAQCCPTLHPAVQLLPVEHDILPLWSASITAARLGDVLDHQDQWPEPAYWPHTLCVIREDEGVAVIELSAEAAGALTRIADGQTLQAALASIEDASTRIQLLAHWIRLPLFSTLESTPWAG